jgi:NAD(P)-dependent dehydrogenase (short-subunit alcohol dehydrogenase family)
MPDSSGIKDKVVAITGASSGIGEATALLLSKRGMKVVLGARGLDRLESMVSLKSRSYALTLLNRRYAHFPLDFSEDVILTGNRRLSFRGVLHPSKFERLLSNSALIRRAPLCLT